MSTETEIPEERTKSLIESLDGDQPVTFEAVVALFRTIQWASRKEVGVTPEQAIEEVRETLKGRPLEERFALLEEIAVRLLCNEQSLSRMLR